ncbi:hypothetical protein OE88DRAFT_1657479 [Heliocybe sulcata]|uniref:Sas10 C-terminal domain-containing protein n=1 Tax=Heliocybe sulcata TaxID=5364 RepID=A0A5C3N4T7_9AGAM|nr:hypothetical protein OE88DRAFT_1657479 [Heliocybe sulcata]
MVRRRSTKLAAKANNKPRGINRKDSKMNKWNTVEDIPMDEEDEFHASRDRILLEGEEDADSDYGEEEEVFSLKGMPETDSEEDEGESGEDYEDKQGSPTQSSTKTSKPRTSKSKYTVPSSESESEDESEPEESWGTKKSAYYSSNAAQLESEDDEANEMEEREAARLQAKARDVLGDDDFGLADAVDIYPMEQDVLDLTTSAEPVALALPTDKKQLIKHLERTSPETLALARDCEDVVEYLKKTKSKLDQMEEDTTDGLLLGMAHLHYQALLTYTTTLAFYLHLRTSPQYIAKPESLRSHPVLTRLLSLKQSLASLEDLDFAASDLDDDDLSDLDEDEEMEDAEELWSDDKKEKKKKGPDILMTPAEFDAFMKQLEAAKAANKAAAAEALQAGEAEAESERPKKKRKTKPSPQPIFDLTEPSLSAFTSSAPSKSLADPDDLYGDPAALTHTDALDKSARKRSLQFYTAKIDSSGAKRERARAQWGGDDDVPYRERKRESEKKKVEEARRRGLVGGEDLDGREQEPEVQKGADESDGEAEGDDQDGYYALVKKKKEKRKEAKKKEYEAQKAASRPDFDDAAASGPRALTRAILKNKGLTPHRSKSVRNPRVKKKQKFEQAKKKIASQKPVFKAGAGDAQRYEGEKSGISKVVKSVRL